MPHFKRFLVSALWLSCGAAKTYVEAPVRAQVVVTPGVATLSWERGLNAQSTLVARTLGSAEPTPPSSLEVGSTLGAGVVLAVTQETSFVDRDLPDHCGPFAWHLWSRAADGAWAKTPTTVRSLRGAQTLAPNVQVTGVRSAFEGAVLHLAWQPPEASTAFEGVTVVRKRGSAPASPIDGVIVYSGPSLSATDGLGNLSVTEPTFYSVFNCNGCGKCGDIAPSIAVTAPSDGGVGVDSADVRAQVSADGQWVDVRWTSTAPRVKVLRTVNAQAMGIDDQNATVVFDGAGAALRERLDLLLPNLPLEARRYVYTVWGCVGDTCSARPATAAFEFTLRQALRGGGYSLFLRHATATTCADEVSLGNASTTTTANWWKRCDVNCGTATAAQLTAGTADGELAAIARFLRDNQVGVGRVVASEFCRAVVTAQALVGDGGVVEPSMALTYFVYDEVNRCRDTVSMLNARPMAGVNTVYVGHADYAAACPVLDSVNPAEVLIYKPVVGAPARYVARVGWAQWAALP
jgi:hypothetical protein